MYHIQINVQHIFLKFLEQAHSEHVSYQEVSYFGMIHY